MFSKIDEKLLVVKKIIDVVSIIFVIIGVISGIALVIAGTPFVGLLMLILFPFIVWLVWVTAQLKLTAMCDLKLIRNKLYEQDNSNLASFGVNINNQDKDTTQIGKQDATFKKLLEQNVITQEEYDILAKDKKEN